VVLPPAPWLCLPSPRAPRLPRSRAVSSSSRYLPPPSHRSRLYLKPPRPRPRSRGGRHLRRARRPRHAAVLPARIGNPPRRRSPALVHRLCCGSATPPRAWPRLLDASSTQPIKPSRKSQGGRRRGASRRLARKARHPRIHHRPRGRYGSGQGAETSLQAAWWIETPRQREDSGLHGGEQHQHAITRYAVTHSSLPSTPATLPFPSAPHNADHGTVLEVFTTLPTKCSTECISQIF